MSALDRAFIRAFSDSADLRLAEVRPATAVPLAVAPAQPTAVLEPLDEVDDTTNSEPSTISAATWLGQSGLSTAPLSAFSPSHASHEHGDGPFEALLEVDHLAWPVQCERMISDARLQWEVFMAEVANQLAGGAKSIALTSCRRAEGRTTMILALCKQLAARGLKGIVVDADFANPMLARSCGIATQTGWGDVLEGKVPLGESLIAAVSDGVTLMPWHGSQLGMPQITQSLRTATSFSLLRDHFDYVLLDTMPLEGPTAIADFSGFAQSAAVDLVYVVRDVRTVSREQLTESCARLARAGRLADGILENFVPADPSSHAPLGAFDPSAPQD